MRKHLKFHTTWIAAIDCLCLLLGGMLAIVMRIGTGELNEYVFSHADGWLIFGASIILANYLAGSYQLQYTFSRFNIVVRWLFSMLFAFLVLSITSYAWFRLILGRGVLFLSVVFYSVFSMLMKMVVYGRLFRSSAFLCRAVVLGKGETARKLRKLVEEDYVLPVHKVVAFIDVPEESGKSDGPDGPGKAFLLDGVAVMRSAIADLEDIIRSLSVKVILIGLDDKNNDPELTASLRRLRFEGIEVLNALNTAEIYGGRTPLELLDDDAVMSAGLSSLMPGISSYKRAADIAVSVLAILFLFPIALVVALLIKLLEPKSPVFYAQKRVGQFGEIFTIFKFRTMREGAEDKTGPVWAGRDDARITPLGRVLRKFRLDEIPQLINVLNGDMSIVGPRPERPEIVEDLTRTIPFYGERVNMVPGLTGWAQVRYPYGSSLDDAKKKLEYDLYYMKYLCMSLDLQIILRTIRIAMFGLERSVE